MDLLQGKYLLVLADQPSSVRGRNQQRPCARWKRRASAASLVCGDEYAAYVGE